MYQGTKMEITHKIIHVKHKVVSIISKHVKIRYSCRKQDMDHLDIYSHKVHMSSWNLLTCQNSHFSMQHNKSQSTQCLNKISTYVNMRMHGFYKKICLCMFEHTKRIVYVIKAIEDKIIHPRRLNLLVKAKTQNMKELPPKT